MSSAALVMSAIFPPFHFSVQPNALFIPKQRHPALNQNNPRENGKEETDEREWKSPMLNGGKEGGGIMDSSVQEKMERENRDRILHL